MCTNRLAEGTFNSFTFLSEHFKKEALVFKAWIILVSWKGTPSRNILCKQRPYLWCGGNGELPQSRSSCLAVPLYRTTGENLSLFWIDIELIGFSRGRLLEERSGKGECACSCHTGNVLKTRFLWGLGHKLDSNNKMDFKYVTNAHAIRLKVIFVVFFGFRAWKWPMCISNEK